MATRGWSLRGAPGLWIAGFATWFGLNTALGAIYRYRLLGGLQVETILRFNQACLVAYTLGFVLVVVGTNALHRQRPGLPMRLVQTGAIAMVTLTGLLALNATFRPPLLWHLRGVAMVLIAGSLGAGAIAARRPIGWAAAAVGLAYLSWGPVGEVATNWWLWIIVNAATAVAFIGAAAMLRPDDGATPLPPARTTTTT